MPEVKETVHAIIYVGADESYSWTWDEEVSEEVHETTECGKTRTIVRPRREGGCE